MTGSPTLTVPAAEAQARIDELLWYHTIDVAPGVVTPGWFDLRHALARIPIPDVTGKRCLDIGTWDGFYAFELERRGAAEVVAIDIPDLSHIDYPPEVRADPDFDPKQEGSQWRSAGFHLIHELTGSQVQWKGLSIYDLDPAELGTFDVVVLGSLLVHLRDPVRALDAVRRVTAPDGGTLVAVDYVHPAVNLLSRGRPMFELRGESADFQWWLASDSGLQRLLHVGGFAIDEMTAPFLLRPGSKYAPDLARRRTRKDLARRAVSWIYSRDAMAGGHLHRAYRTHRRF
jgi:tRNA (mo5U34)-methyltransferase